MSTENYQRFLGLLQNDESITDPRQRAYVLATVKHECSRRGVPQWKPLYEMYNGDPVEYFTAKYGHRKDLGNVVPEDGYTFRGRGFPQLTGRGNYLRLSDYVGIDLVANPDAAMDYDTSYRILTIGMRLGLFTGRKLADFIHDEKCDYVWARSIINGIPKGQHLPDKAELIASYARTFERELLPLGA